MKKIFYFSFGIFAFIALFLPNSAKAQQDTMYYPAMDNADIANVLGDINQVLFKTPVVSITENGKVIFHASRMRNRTVLQQGLVTVSLYTETTPTIQLVVVSTKAMTKKQLLEFLNESRDCMQSRNP